MKIAILGAGAIGCVIAGYLKKDGRDCVLVGKKDQVEAINKSGLAIEGIRGSHNIKIAAQEKLNQKPDLIILAVKTQDIRDIMAANTPYCLGVPVLTTQNGVRSDKILSEIISKKDIASSIVMFGATYLEPGKAVHNFEGDWIIGCPFEKNEQLISKINDIAKDSFKVVISDDIMAMKWVKIFLNFNNCLPAALGKSMQDTFTNIDICKISIGLLKEGLGVAQKADINLLSLPQFPKERLFGLASMPLDEAANIFSKTMTGLSKEPLYGSILQSIKRGRLSEIEYINGEIVNLANSIGVGAPLNKAIVDIVHNVEKNKKFYSEEGLIKAVSQIGG